MKAKSRVHSTPKQAGAALLDGSLDRRGFVSRLLALGVALPSARTLLASLQTPAGAGPATRRLAPMTGGEVTAEFLRDWNVEYVFGLGGSEEVGFLDALVDRSDLQYVLALHEGSAMSMADGYARASKKTGFLNLHSIAGTGYALGPMVNAYKDRTPVVITVGRQSSDVRGSRAFLEATNLHMVPRDYTRWTWDVMSAETIPDTLRRAFLLARVPPGGPTFVTFSKDFWEVEVEGASIVQPERSPVETALTPDPELIDRAAEALRKAARPLLVAGRELSLHGGLAEMVQLAELSGAQVVSDVAASHSPISFPTSHPQYGGLFAMEPEAGEFDLFWSIGGTMFTLFANPPEPLVPADTFTIHSSIEGAQIGLNYPVDLALTGHPRSILQAVVAKLETDPGTASRIAQRRAAASDVHARRKQRLEDEAAAHWDGSPVPPERVVVELNRRLAPDAQVITELATSDFYVWRHLDFNQDRHGRGHITSAGGCLGWGLGAAVGAKIGAPQRQTVLLVGDGSFQFGVQALWSAVRYQVPVAIIIFNNRAYQANRRALHNYGRRAAETGKYVGCYLGTPDIDHVGIAQGYGVEGERVEDSGRLGAALERCLKTVDGGRPYLVDVIVEPRFPGADSTWIDSFSVATGAGRRS